MVRDGHGLESDLFGILEVRVRPPDAFQPVNIQQPVNERVE